MKIEQRFAYYRRCQVVMRNGEQCRCPALKGGEICRNHADQIERLTKRTAAQEAVLRVAAEKMESRTGRKHTTEDVMRTPRGILAALDEVGQALIEGRLDERGAWQMLRDLQDALRDTHHGDTEARRNAGAADQNRVIARDRVSG